MAPLSALCSLSLSTFLGHSLKDLGDAKLVGLVRVLEAERVAEGVVVVDDILQRGRDVGAIVTAQIARAVPIDGIIRTRERRRAAGCGIADASLDIGREGLDDGTLCGGEDERVGEVDAACKVAVDEAQETGFAAARETVDQAAGYLGGCSAREGEREERGDEGGRGCAHVCSRLGGRG